MSMVCPLCGHQPPMCGSRAAGGFLFFARAKKRNQKKAHPVARRTACGSLRSSRGRARAELAERCTTRVGLEQRLANSPGPAAVLGELRRDRKPVAGVLILTLTSGPVAAAEHRSRRRIRPRVSAVRAGSANPTAAQGGAVGRAPPSARSGRSRASMRSAAFVHPCTAQGSSAASGRAFDVQGRTNVWPAQGCASGPDLLPSFLCTSKEKKAAAARRAAS